MFQILNSTLYLETLLLTIDHGAARQKIIQVKTLSKQSTNYLDLLIIQKHLPTMVPKCNCQPTAPDL